MGQIIIDLPLRVKRRYKIDDVDSANELLAALKTKAKRVESDSQNLTAEDLADIRAAKRAREKGEFISLEELKTELGI